MLNEGRLELIWWMLKWLNVIADRLKKPVPSWQLTRLHEGPRQQWGGNEEHPSTFTNCIRNVPNNATSLSSLTTNTQYHGNTGHSIILVLQLYSNSFISSFIPQGTIHTRFLLTVWQTNVRRQAQRHAVKALYLQPSTEPASAGPGEYVWMSNSAIHGCSDMHVDKLGASSPPACSNEERKNWLVKIGTDTPCNTHTNILRSYILPLPFPPALKFTKSKIGIKVAFRDSSKPSPLSSSSTPSTNISMHKRRPRNDPNRHTHHPNPTINAQLQTSNTPPTCAAASPLAVARWPHIVQATNNVPMQPEDNGESGIGGDIFDIVFYQSRAIPSNMQQCLRARKRRTCLGMRKK